MAPRDVTLRLTRAEARIVWLLVCQQKDSGEWWGRPGTWWARLVAKLEGW